ncbi:hypothetical protein C8Q77DRAFT_180994 [Trametes polyzona]|nr:hypothetical protein C8Q77DRAFT_180994 [Trametes polyzona]
MMAYYTPAAPPPPLSATPSVRGARKRYPQAVYDIFTEYYNNVNPRPSFTECATLADRARRIKGAEDCTADKVQAYFKTKYKRTRKPGDPPASSGRSAYMPHQINAPQSASDILYPTLLTDPSILANIRVLLHETPKPKADVAKIWASRLGRGVYYKDIITYAKLRLAREEPGNPTMRLHTSPPSQLPTPESSTSPEPRSTPTSPVVETSWGKTESDEDVKDELDESDYESEEEEEVDEAETKWQPPKEEAPVPDPRAALIADALYKGLTKPPPSPTAPNGRPPKTIKELCQWFKEQECLSLPNYDAPGKQPAQEAPGTPTMRCPQSPRSRTLA